MKSKDVQTRDDQMSSRCSFYHHIPQLALWIGGSGGKTQHDGGDKGGDKGVKHGRKDGQSWAAQSSSFGSSIRRQVFASVISALFHKRRPHLTEWVVDPFIALVFDVEKVSLQDLTWVKFAESVGERTGVSFSLYTVWTEAWTAVWVCKPAAMQYETELRQHQ